jgi:hypothetical protein
LILFSKCWFKQTLQGKGKHDPPVQLKGMNFPAVTVLRPFLLGAFAITSIKVTSIAGR